MGVLDGRWVTFSTGKLHFRISMCIVLTFSAKVLALKYLQCYKWTLDGLHHENARQPSEQNLHT